jgi:predicted unusual protein kinase regulating ubiquinone biosynthesis (AarF/ABC1/UbiB family)
MTERGKTSDRRGAERAVLWTRLWARIKQIVTTDPTGSDDDDHMVDEQAARALAASAGRLKGGLAKVAQLAAYDPGATLGGVRGATAAARAVLADLWDQAPAVSGDAIAQVIQADLGRPPDQLFATWDPTPLAAASLGQVHAATLHDGTPVVVKVQYPGVAEALDADLGDAGFVRKLAGAELGRSLDTASVAALAAAVRGEIDYRAEAHALECFAAAWADPAAMTTPGEANRHGIASDPGSAVDALAPSAGGGSAGGGPAGGGPAGGGSAGGGSAGGGSAGGGSAGGGSAGGGRAALRFPRVIRELSSARVLTMTRARGKTVVETAASGSPELRRDAALAIYAFAWGSPLIHGLVNADPNPGNFLIDEQPDGSAAVWCLDFGCALELPPEVRDADREIWWALIDDDSESAAERFRIALSNAGLLRRADSLASTAHRDWERALAAPVTTHGAFAWAPRYASELADATARVLGAGGVALPANVLLLWRQRLGAAAVIAMLDSTAPFRRVLIDLIGTGRRTLR